MLDRVHIAIRLSSAVFVTCLLCIGCGQDRGDDPNVASTRDGTGTFTIDEVRERGELIVLTRNAPTTYYEGRNHPEGLEYELAIAFAEHIGVPARFVIKETVAEILDGLESGEGDVAAAGLTHTGPRARRFFAGPPYKTVSQQVVSRRGVTPPKAPAALVGRDIEVIAGSSYAARLEELREQHVDIAYRTIDGLSTEQLLERVWKRELDLTVADNSIVAINRRYYPELVVAFDLTEPQDIVWYFPHAAEALWRESCEWFGHMKDSGALARMEQQIYGYIEVFDYVDIRRFIRRIDERLPKYRDLFLKAGDRWGVPWTVLAAVAYQESHWRPHAKSPTGVRGMMMLSLPTASEVGVTNRLDAEQSINGGARYLMDLYYRLPPTITGPDRGWFTLAAYNIGLYHVYDARTIARRLGKNPDAWSDMVEVLPLLSQKEYYKTVRYGYARGSEPVRYVTRIRDYHDILKYYVKTVDSDGPWRAAGQP